MYENSTLLPVCTEGGFKHIDGSSALTQELQACAATGWVAAGAAFIPSRVFGPVFLVKLLIFGSILFSCLQFLSCKQPKN